LYKYGIILSVILTIVGPIQQQCQCRILQFVRHFVRQKLNFLQKVSDNAHRSPTTKKCVGHPPICFI
jgi:hypothetical protein